MKVSEQFGEKWLPDFRQTVFQSKRHFFEIDEPGETDYFRRSLNNHGNSICYLGIYVGDDRDRFIGELNKNFGDRVLIYQLLDFVKIQGDWTVLDTEDLLGCDLCLKKYDPDHQVKEIPAECFEEIYIAVRNLEKTLENWKKIFVVNDFQLYENEDLKAVILQGDIKVTLVEFKSEALLKLAERQNYGVIAVRLADVKGNVIKKYANDQYELMINEEKITLYDSKDKLGTCIVL